eukprot:s761_g16.t1
MAPNISRRGHFLHVIESRANLTYLAFFSWKAAKWQNKVRLHTGRQHQIRAHLAFEGHPLVGDTAYGGDAEWCSRTFLHSAQLALTAGRPFQVTCPVPADLQDALMLLEILGRDVLGDVPGEVQLEDGTE